MTQRIGLIARGDNRGIGVITAEFARHLHPTKVLGVDMVSTPYENHWDRYPDCDLRIATFDRNADYAGDRAGSLAMDDVRWLLEDVDVVYCVETPYNYELFNLARDRGVRTVLHYMYEFLRYIPDPALPHPDHFWAPSTWHLADARRQLLVPVRYVPVPVARDRLPYRPRETAGAFLHVAGHRAMRDRNGTSIVNTALGYVANDATFLLRGQSNLPSRIGKRSRMQVIAEHADVENYWDLYAGADVLVLPRRYAGLSLPMQEALSLGMPVITLDVAPQNEFVPAEGLIQADPPQMMLAQVGEIECYHADPLRLALKIDEFVNEPGIMQKASAKADDYASSISWDALGATYRDLLENA